MAILLDCYGFDLQERSPAEYIKQWLTSCSKYWIRLAIIEALYQGRYKAISVDHILRRWKRRGNPTFHFTHEFERMICRNIVINKKNRSLIESQFLTTKFQTSKKIDQLDKKYIHPQPLKDLSSPEQQDLPQSSQNVARQSESKYQTIDSTDGNLKNELSVDELVSLSKKSKNIKSKCSIHKFIPHSDSSQLYVKLRAAVYQKLAQ